MSKHTSQFSGPSEAKGRWFDSSRARQGSPVSHFSLSMCRFSTSGAAQSDTSYPPLPPPLWVKPPLFGWFSTDDWLFGPDSLINRHKTAYSLIDRVAQLLDLSPPGGDLESKSLGRPTFLEHETLTGRACRPPWSTHCNRSRRNT